MATATLSAMTSCTSMASASDRSLIASCATDDYARYAALRSRPHPRRDGTGEQAFLVEPRRTAGRGRLPRVAERGISGRVIVVRGSRPAPIPQADGCFAAARRTDRLQRGIAL